MKKQISSFRSTLFNWKNTNLSQSGHQPSISKEKDPSSVSYTYLHTCTSKLHKYLIVHPLRPVCKHPVNLQRRPNDLLQYNRTQQHTYPISIPSTVRNPTQNVRYSVYDQPPLLKSNSYPSTEATGTVLNQKPPKTRRRTTLHMKVHSVPTLYHHLNPRRIKNPQMAIRWKKLSLT